MTQTKTCRKCGEDKDLSHFWNKRDGKHGKASVCIECEKPRMQSRKRNRRIDTARRYNLTLDELMGMMTRQAGACAICGGSNDDGSNLHVDHNHDTLQVRELLCRQCNLMIGYAREDETVLLRAVQYLRRWSE